MRVVEYMKLKINNGHVCPTESWSISPPDPSKGAKLYGICYANGEGENNPYIEFQLDIDGPIGMDWKGKVRTIIDQLKLTKKKSIISLLVMEV